MMRVLENDVRIDGDGVADDALVQRVIPDRGRLHDDAGVPQGLGELLEVPATDLAGVANEGGITDDQREEQATEGVDVAAWIELLTGGALGADEAEVG